MWRALCVALLVVSACGGVPSPSAAQPAQRVDAGPLLSAQLRDVRGGQTFTLGGFSGKVVLVEGMAVWCPLCTEQQRNIARALPSLGSDVVMVSLDVDPNETEDVLRRYVERTGFNWRFAVVPPGMANALQAAFGTQFLSPPSTPLAVIDPRGELHTTPSGIKNADEINKLVERYR